MLSDLTCALADHGLAVKVVTSRSSYDDPDLEFPARATVNGVEIHRVWTSRLGRASLVKRAVDYLTFYLSASAAIVRFAGRGDVVVCKTDPPLLSVALVPLARLKAATPANWLQDIFPEVAVRLGLPIPALVAHLLRALRNWSLRRADFNVTISEGMAEYLEGQGVPGNRIQVVHNWSDGVEPVLLAENKLRREWGLTDRFV
ncbi:MAG: glycosyltransferase, partial [Planctomycetota bacterium]